MESDPHEFTLAKQSEYADLEIRVVIKATTLHHPDQPLHDGTTVTSFEKESGSELIDLKVKWPKYEGRV